MIVLAVGPDHFLVERRVREVAHSADPDRLNTTRFDRSTPINEVVAAVSTMGFFGTGRVVIADGVLARASGNGKAKQVEEVAELFAAVAPGNTLILADETIQSIPAAVRKLESAPFEEFIGKPARGSELVKWVTDEVSRENGRIDRQAINELLNILYPGTWQAPDRNPAYDQPPDLQTLMSEIGKLVTAAGGKEITAKLVREMVHLETQDQLFPLVDAIAAGKVVPALKILGEVGADDETASRAITQLATTAELAQIAIGMRDADAKEVGAQLGQSEKRMTTVKNMNTPKRAADLAEVMLTSDRRLKTGKTRSPVSQLHDLLITQASKTRDR